MPNMIGPSGSILPNSAYKRVAASATTSNISTPGNTVPGNDYVSHLLITAASTAAPGAVTLFDGTTALVVHQFVAGTMTELTQKVDIDAIAQTTKGFNVTTGTSVAVVVVGRFG